MEKILISNVIKKGKEAEISSSIKKLERMTTEILQSVWTINNVACKLLGSAMSSRIRLEDGLGFIFSR